MVVRFFVVLKEWGAGSLERGTSKKGKAISALFRDGWAAWPYAPGRVKMIRPVVPTL